jgi:hypothetical protein
MKKASRKVLEERIQARIRRLGECSVSIGGSLATISRRCGRPNCRCATDKAARHPAHLLNSKVKGRTRSVYIPVDMVEEVSSWVRERRNIQRLLKEIDQLAEQLIRLHVPASRAAARNLARPKSTPPTTCPSS